MPYAFDYAVASSYGASFAAREEENGRGTVGQFQMVGQNPPPPPVIYHPSILVLSLNLKTYSFKNNELQLILNANYPHLGAGASRSEQAGHLLRVR